MSFTRPTRSNSSALIKLDKIPTEIQPAVMSSCLVESNPIEAYKLVP